MANKDEDFSLDSLTHDDFMMSAVDLFGAAEQIISFKKSAEQFIDEENDSIIKNPILAIGIVLLSRLDRMHFDFAETEHRKCSLLSDLIESIDCAGAKRIEHWMHSDIAAIDKAKELGVDILPEYSIADLRYKIDLALREVI